MSGQPQLLTTLLAAAAIAAAGASFVAHCNHKVLIGEKSQPHTESTELASEAAEEQDSEQQGQEAEASEGVVHAFFMALAAQNSADLASKRPCLQWNTSMQGMLPLAAAAALACSHTPDSSNGACTAASFTGVSTASALVNGDAGVDPFLSSSSRRFSLMSSVGGCLTQEQQQQQLFIAEDIPAARTQSLKTESQLLTACNQITSHCTVGDTPGACSLVEQCPQWEGKHNACQPITAQREQHIQQHSTHFNDKQDDLQPQMQEYVNEGLSSCAVGHQQQQARSHCCILLDNGIEYTTSDACAKQHSQQLLSQLQQQHQQLQELLSGLCSQQHSPSLACQVSKAEELAVMLHQQCSNLRAETQTLKVALQLTKAQSVQAEASHQACLSNLAALQEHQVQQEASSKRALQQLQELLQRMQAVLQQHQQQDEEQLATRSANIHGEQQQCPQHELQQNSILQQQAHQQEQQRLQDAVQQHGHNECSSQWGQHLIRQLESCVMQLLRVRDSDKASVHHYKQQVQQLNTQVQQLNTELQQATCIAEASVLDKQQLERAHAALQRQLYGCQQQLLKQHQDLSVAVHNYRTTAAEKAKLQQQLQETELQQQALQDAAKQAVQSADIAEQKAKQLLERSAVTQAALSASVVAEKQKAHELKLAQSERDNSLHQVAELQLKLHEAESKGTKRLQEVQLEHSKKLQEVQSEHSSQLHEIQSEHSKKLMELQHQLAEVRSASDVLVKQLQEQLEQQVREVQELQQQLTSVQTAQQEAVKQSESAEAQVKQLQQGLTAAKTERATAAQQAADLLQPLQAASDDVTPLMQKLREANEARDSHKQAAAQLQQRLDEAAVEVKQLQGERKAAKRARDSALEELSTVKTQLQHAVEDKQQLKLQLAALQTELDQAQQPQPQVTELQQQLHDVNAGYDQLKQQLSELQSERERAEQLQLQVAKLQQQHAVDASQVTVLQDKLQQAEEQLHDLQDATELESNQLVEALDAAQARIAGSTQQIAEAQHDVGQLTQLVQIQQQQLAWQHETIRKLKAVVPHTQLQVLLPDSDCTPWSSACTSPVPASPRPNTMPQSARSSMSHISRPGSPSKLPSRPPTPYKQQQQTSAKLAGGTPIGDAHTAGAAGAEVEQHHQQQGSCVQQACAPLYVNPVVSAAMWSNDTSTDDSCSSMTASAGPVAHAAAPAVQQVGAPTPNALPTPVQQQSIASVHNDAMHLSVVSGADADCITGEHDSSHSCHRVCNSKSVTAVPAQGTNAALLAGCRSSSNSSNSRRVSGTSSCGGAVVLSRQKASSIKSAAAEGNQLLLESLSDSNLLQRQLLLKGPLASLVSGGSMSSSAVATGGSISSLSGLSDHDDECGWLWAPGSTAAASLKSGTPANLMNVEKVFQ